MKAVTSLILPLALLASTSAFAYPTSWGSDVTINDQNLGNGSWYDGSNDQRPGGIREDEEVEPGMSTQRGWDAEGFFQNQNQLTIVGEFNYSTGKSNFQAGDLFIDINGDAVFGDIHGSSNGYQNVTNTFGYDFVFDIDWTNLTYDVYAIDGSSILGTTYYAQNQGSNPFQFHLGDNAGATAIASNSFSISTFDSAQIDGYFLGGTHYAANGFDLSFLGGNANYTSHWTMGCGNDNLMGQGTTVPEPGTIGLLAAGLIGLGFARRRMSSNQA